MLLKKRLAKSNINNLFVRRFVTDQLTESMMQRIDSLSWETIIDMGGGIEFKIKTEKEELNRLKKELNAMKIVLSERLKYSNTIGSFDPKMIMDIVSLLEKTDAIAKQYEVDIEHFRQYLSLVLAKLKKEKLGAKKTSNVEFQKRQLDEKKAGP